MSDDYAYEHAWDQERIRLAGLEAALNPGTRAHLLRLGAGSGRRCLEVGAGGGSVALWLAEVVGPQRLRAGHRSGDRLLESEAARLGQLEVLAHDITAEDLPGGFDVVPACWLVEWLPDRSQALRRMADALRPGGVLLDEEPDFITMYEAAQPASLRRVVRAASRAGDDGCSRRRRIHCSRRVSDAVCG
jgi:SAM-dependent methyltransferase